MSFISYAQNYEDVMLRRALKDVDKGIYIDVGAYDPIADSVTKAFYDVGWRGINIEPVSECFEKIRLDRPDDINLQLAVGVRKGEVNFHEVVGTGLSTMDELLAKRHAQEHGFELKSYRVPVVRLTTICEQYPHTEIHFLKIDVEGSEKSVLQGLNLKKIRPWIILVESTLPNTQIENHEEWEPILTDRGFHYVYFDGLNRFYIADEHDELDVAFRAPPNYFDDFKRVSEDWLGRHCNWLENELDVSKAKLSQKKESADRIEAAMLESEQHCQRLETQLQTLRAEAHQSHERLREKEIKQQELLLSLAEKERKLQEVRTKLTDNNWQIGRSHTSLIDSQKQRQALKAMLQDTEMQRQQLETQLQILQAEVGQFGEKLREKEESINWLHNEWEAAKHQIDELHQSNHHWWLEADRLNKELQALLDSKSWRITWPLRSLLQFFNGLFSLLSGLMLWVVCIPKQTVRWLLVKAMALILKYPGIHIRAITCLQKYPRLGIKLRQLAREPVPVDVAYKGFAWGTDLSDLTPNARRIHGDLKTAIEERQKEYF